MKRITLVLSALALVTVLGAVAADACTSRVDQRQAYQHARIRQGVRNGQLTPREAMRLRMGQRHVRRMEWRAKSDGVLSWRERARLNHAQNVQSRRIYRLKHNRRSV
jgi:uncharacterized membrane protein YebE (DUF533 family)